MRIKIAGIASALAVALLMITSSATPVGAAGNLVFPGPAGSTWTVLAGYNTATHSVADANDPYAIDLTRTDAPTANSPVLAPISGTVRYVSDRCVSIRDASNTTVMMCHILAPQSLRNATVTRGQQIGTVAPDGQAGNNGTAHIHLALSPAGGGPLPFTGAYALDGVEMPAIATSNGYAGTTFTSTNRALPGADAGVDRTVAPGAAVTLNATVTNPTGAGLFYTWTQTSGTTVALQQNGPTATFTAPSRTGRVDVRLTVADGTDLISDTVTITVANSQPAATPTPVPAQTPAAVIGAASTGFVANPVFGTNAQALAVFPGGPVTQLESAATRAGATGIWVQDAEGGYQLLILKGATFLRDSFVARFPGGFAGPRAVTLIR